MTCKKGLSVCTMLIATLALASAAQASTTYTWSAAHPMSSARYDQVAALLSDGTVLVAGGIPSETSSACLSSAEIYNPASDSWSSAAPMGTARCAASAVTLPDGKVLVLGGSNSSKLDTAEVYDPATNHWTPTANNMSSARGFNPVAVLLQNGKVLVAGGLDSSSNPTATADLYDPATNRFTATDSMGTARNSALGVLLSNGKVLVAGGNDNNGFSPYTSGEVYDPSTGHWTPVSNQMSEGREYSGSAAAPLPNGHALLAGGEVFGTGGPNIQTTQGSADTDVYDSSSNTFSPGPTMNTGRFAFAMTPLAGGDVLAAGGVASGSVNTMNGTDTATMAPVSEIYDPTANTWTNSDTMPTSVSGETLTTLPGGQVVATGGQLSDGQTGSDETSLFAPTSQNAPKTAPGRPTAVAAAAGNGSAEVTFAPPASDGGSQILHYTVTASTGQSVTTPDGRTYATVTGLTNGKPVTFTVTATNAVGTGFPSAPSNAVVPTAGNPTHPTTHPRITLTGVPKHLRRRRLLKGLTFTVTANEPASLKVSLLGTAKHATISRAFDVILASKALRADAGQTRITLRPNRKLIGHHHRATVELLVTATDANGNEVTAFRTIRLRA